MAPTFTLRLTEVQVKEFLGINSSLIAGSRFALVARTRWLLESDDPAWTPLHSGEGNINGLDHDDWAKRWATEQVAEHSPYTVVRWVENEEPHDEGPVWTAELKRIRHDFRVAFADDEVATVQAKNADDAAEVRRRVLDGENFVELMLNGDPVLINLAHVGTLIYLPTEVDL